MRIPLVFLTNLDNEKKDLSEVDEALSKLILLSYTTREVFVKHFYFKSNATVFSFLLFALSKFPTNLIFLVFVKNFQQDFSSFLCGSKTEMRNLSERLRIHTKIHIFFWIRIWLEIYCRSSDVEVLFPSCLKCPQRSTSSHPKKKKKDKTKTLSSLWLL